VTGDRRSGHRFGRHDRPLLAGTSQSGVQVGCPKPVIRGGPARKIQSGSPGSGYGRLLEVTNGFVEAKREKPRLSVGQPPVIEPC